MRKTTGRLWAVATALGTVVMLTTGYFVPLYSASAAPVTNEGTKLIVPLGNANAEIDLTSLQIDFEKDNGERVRWAEPAILDGKVDGFVNTDDTALWDYSGIGLSASASQVEGRLHIILESDRDVSLEWPATGQDSHTTSIEFTRGSGQTIPVADPFWLAAGEDLFDEPAQLAGDLSMPFWGTTYDTQGLNVIVPTDIGTTLEFKKKDERIYAQAAHEFSADRQTSTYEVIFTPTTGGAVDAALDYRDYLHKTSGIVTLREKIEQNPNVESLIGAPHAYVWGDGRDPELVHKLNALGINRMWIGYDADGSPPSPYTVSLAQDSGFLVAPYDTWANAQDPEKSDTPAALWPSPLWPDGCVMNKDGTPVTGFGGRGCYLSSAALRQAQKDSNVLTERVKSFTENGVQSYFLDVDAVGQLFRDYNPLRPATEAEDRKIRLERMKALALGEFSQNSPLVTGSEAAADWANSAISYSHGSSTPVPGSFFSFQKNTAVWGGYYPLGRPGIFFKEADLPDDLATKMFAPEYRVPLYQTVLHDSVISTDRWELGLYKLPQLSGKRTLLSLLYNEPINLALDTRELEAHGEEIARIQKFFMEIQDVAGLEPLTSFEFLDDTKRVQQTVFGDGVLTLTANFGDSLSGGVDAGCISAALPGAKTITYCTP
ncbi:glycoside hydrolase [Lysinibacter sp. HNR]|uniref:glycoside hydrolase n=1 Tax=Lysinibacter sp. HNR TaxID=3031408 RepID=UPI002434EDC1|nr:glycoside hydrolase [Lysinibacter sp. HNR]WGD36685.1 glycoside hydrolase [Lysinibacter sp. HNR]